MIETTLNIAREKMKKALEVSRSDIASIRSGRATPALVENIIIMAYGGSQKLRIMELATITTMDAKTIVIAPYDPSTVAEIEKGIMEANTGLTPVVDREIIRITIPPLSEERRHEYIRLAKTKLEAGKVMVRQVRGDAMRDLKKLEEAKSISEDERKHGERLIQELTDEMIAELDTMGTRKEAELLQV
jgi:ribosome recycling factor